MTHKFNDTHVVINVSLYAATLLLVSGIVLLSQTIGLANSVRFGLIWALIMGCYKLGFLLVRKVPITKPAAIAFVGTALTSVPIGVSQCTCSFPETPLCVGSWRR